MDVDTGEDSGRNIKMQERGLLRADRIREYLDNLDRQVRDLEEFSTF